MKSELILLLIGLTLGPGFCENPTPNPQLSVRVLDYVNLSFSDRDEMETTAASVLRSARVPIAFVECYTGGADTGAETCTRELGSTDLSLRILQSKMAVKRKQLAYAAMAPEGGACITIFINPVQQRARVDGLTNGALLGYALAHEIGHLLLGPNSHSSGGIMRPVWRQVDEEWMAKRALFFDSTQSRQMQKALAARLIR